MSAELYYYDEDEDEEVCPDYNAATSVRRSNTVTTTSSGATSSSGASGSSAGSRNVHWNNSAFDAATRSLPPLRTFTSHAQLRHAATSPSPSPPPTTPLRLRLQRFLYTYTLVADGAPLTFLLSVEPSNGKPTPGKYTLRLSLKVDDVERPIGEPVTLRLSVDPRKLEFAVFIFPGKANVLPVGCLYSLRVWLRANGVDHRIFGEDELWVGADPDFGAVENASFACLRPGSAGATAAPDAQVFDAVVGRARVQFVIRWHPLGDRYYRYTMEYAAGGVGNMLMDDLRLRVEGDPRRVAFLVYTVPVRSVPKGASHRVRVWLRTRAAPHAPAASTPRPVVASESCVYQRVWKSDAFKIGARLDFEALGPRVVMGAMAGPPQTVAMENALSSPVGYQRDAKSPIV
ncbi:hypothetical protein MVEN_01187700 [Mycena venus]|uniref:Uncharacterized protein n=1 Tax=Mycena venus TaxID=2733690 RepID=A0A8H7CYM7_9AGAR|nr:hypothetical protein MVEN_01187700 [Mycena venus]